MDTNLKAPLYFSRFLLNKHFKQLLASIPKKLSSHQIQISLLSLVHLIDTLNETWFSFATDLTQAEEALRAFTKVINPIEERYQETIKTLPQEYLEAFNIELYYFRNRLKETETFSDITQKISSHYIYLLDLIETSLCFLTLLIEAQSKS